MSRSPLVKESFQALITEDNQGFTKVNQYKITDLIGIGSYASVSLGFDINTNKQYAFKQFFIKKQRYKYSSSSASDLQSTVKKEIAILKRINHVNVVKLYEVLNYDNIYFLVLELCENGPLMKVKLNENFEKFDLVKAKHYFMQMFLGIEYLHFNNIVHCDIKPDNLLLDRNLNLKITDFGVSQIFELRENQNNNDSEPVGSPAFLAPEVLKENIITKAVDMWSMGVVVFCMVAGELPFKGKNVIELENNIINSEIEYGQISVLEKEKELRNALEELLNKDYEKRMNVEELRNHKYWFSTKYNQSILLSKEENTKNIVDGLSNNEIKEAIMETKSVWKVAQAVNKFKSLKRRISDKNKN